MSNHARVTVRVPSRHALDGLTVEEVAPQLASRPGFVWLDSADATRGRCVSVLASDPTRILTGSISDVRPLRAALAAFPASQKGDLGLMGPGLYGTVDYEGSYTFGVYPEVLVYEHASSRWMGKASEFPARAAKETEVLPPLDFQPRWSRAAYLSATRRALDYIAAGDIYQVNLAQSFAAPAPAAAAFPFYERLRAFSATAHCSFLNNGTRQLMSASPELFLRMSGSSIQTRPIKGTRARSRDPQQDERLAYELRTSAKEIAELIMITDLERNDLGQVCAFGSVRATDLLKLERFEQVFHLVSSVSGTLRPEIDHLEAFQACFPGGSISGAPKKRALEIIAELEPCPRGLYTGAIGCFGANGESQFSLAIRTAVAEGGQMHFHTGAGIVADSCPEREYEETWHKAATLLGAAGWARGGSGP